MEQLTKQQELKLFNKIMLNKTLTMFEYTNLPETIPAVELEKQLQMKGYSAIAKVDGKLYAFQGGLGGKDVYNRPTQINVSNPALNYNATLKIGVDTVIAKNDDMQLGLIKLFNKYGNLIIENQLTMLINDYNLRIPFIITSSDDQTTDSARLYLQKIVDGSLGVITENKLWESLKVNPTASHSNSNFADLYGYQQYLISALNNNIGLATNNNMKRERLTTNEIEVNKNASYPLVDNMLKNRQEAVEQINQLFGTDISVKFSSIWAGINEDNNEAPEDDPVDVSEDDPVTVTEDKSEDESEPVSEDEPEAVTETKSEDEPEETKDEPKDEKESKENSDNDSEDETQDDYKDDPEEDKKKDVGK